MIKNQWYIVLEACEVKEGKVLGATRFGEKLVFFRDTKGEAACIADKCAHRGVSLTIGAVKGDCVQCPFHGFEYDSTGKCTLIPANGKNAKVPDYVKVKGYKTVEKHGYIWLWYGEEQEKYPEINFFEDIGSDFSYAWSASHWGVHYSRGIENQLDVVHLPFVHKTTIGRGGKALVNGPIAVVEEGNLEFWVYNETDTGQTPLKPEEALKTYGTPSREKQHIHFRYPNFWQNWLTEKLRIIAVFVPVDDENMVLYLRYAQKMVKAPIIKDIFNWLGIKMSDVIANQDKRVVITQLPKKTELQMDEKLIQGDLPIVMYRKKRKELQEGK